MKALIAAGTAVLAFIYRCFSLFGTRQRIVCISRQSNEASIDFTLIQDYFSVHYPSYEVIILSKELAGGLVGKMSYCAHIVTQLFYIATSRAVVLDSYCIVVSLLHKRIKAPVIQMWHAMGNMKCFGWASLGEEEGRSQKTAEVMHMHAGYDSVLISSMNFAADYAAGFGIDQACIYETPLPRTDLLLNTEEVAKQAEAVYQAFPQTRMRKNIVYAPTFRRTPAPNEEEAMQALVDAVDFTRYNLVYQRHPVSTQRISDARVIQDYAPELKVLAVADYVISDYSTVIYEAGLRDIPVYLYAYDWETYSAKRSLNINIEREVPTLFSTDAKRIMRAIEQNEFDHDAFRAFIANNIALPQEKTCTQQVCEHIMSLITGVYCRV